MSKLELKIEAEIINNDLGPWVELYLVSGDKKRAIMSEPLNPNYRSGIEAAAFGLIANAFEKVLRAN